MFFVEYEYDSMLTRKDQSILEFLRSIRWLRVDGFPFYYYTIDLIEHRKIFALWLFGPQITQQNLGNYVIGHSFTTSSLKDPLQGELLFVLDNGSPTGEHSLTGFTVKYQDYLIVSDIKGIRLSLPKHSVLLGFPGGEYPLGHKQQCLKIIMGDPKIDSLAKRNFRKQLQSRLNQR
jgi:hypothetical protein